MSASRFDYPANRSDAQGYHRYHGAFWPPADDYAVSAVTLSPPFGDAGAEVVPLLVSLRDVIEAEWLLRKASGDTDGSAFSRADTVSSLLRGIAACLPNEADREALGWRADAVDDGYDEVGLQALADLEEDVTVVAGHLATWFGKHPGGMPTAFGCRVDAVRQRVVSEALQDREDVGRYLATLHPDLQLGAVAAFSVTQLFFMAGEGNLHPKHVAYFLPADEGVKYSPFKKTYYFANTHERLLCDQSAPLADRLLDIGVAFDPTSSRARSLSTLGVLGHEFGHAVSRSSTSYTTLNRADRWASAVLQEVAADVFGVLFMAEIWATRFDYDLEDVIAYYLAECLRYVHRGLGHFPDSDGMYLQLAYLVQVGALELTGGEDPRLVGDPPTVLAGLRSLARVLADAVLAGAAGSALALHQTCGPASAGPLRPLVDALSRHPARSVEYLQDGLDAHVAAVVR